MTRHGDRRAFLEASAAGLAAGALGHPVGGAEDDAHARPQTFVYKTVGGCELKADVHGASRGPARPVAVWFHGGALITGDRHGIDRALLAELVKAGFVVVSFDYRLAPETKLPAILDDVRDALGWVRAEGPRRFGARADRLVVLGGSAGGYLTLVSGFLVKPRPAALVSFWGYGDIAGAWYSRPDPFYRRQPLVTEAAARASVGGKVLAEPPPKHERSRFYLYCRQNGLWSREVAGHDPDTEPRAFDPFCPVRNVSPDDPPTLLVHGTNDTDVPYEQSVLMDRELTRRGVPHELITLQGAGHGLRGVDKAVVADLYRRVLAFLGRYAG
jgi:acetyl esterase/lipase